MDADKSLVRRDRVIGSVPATLISPASSGPQPTVLLSHGLSGDRHQLEAAQLLLAEHGFLTVAIDNVGHGDRARPEVETWAWGEDSMMSQFLDLVDETAAELPALVDALVAEGLSDETRVGMVGLSMGGYIAYAAVGLEPRISAITAITGTPEWERPRPTSPHLRPEVYFPVAVLSQSAEMDEIVDADAAARLHSALAPFYSEEPDLLKRIVYPGSGHVLSPAHARQAWMEAVEWCVRWI